MFSHENKNIDSEPRCLPKLHIRKKAQKRKRSEWITRFSTFIVTVKYSYAMRKTRQPKNEEKKSEIVPLKIPKKCKNKKGA